MTRDDAIAKIRKLLNRKGRTEAESDTAQMLAAALAEKHSIDIAELDRLDQAAASQITHKTVGEWLHVPPEADYAATICNRFFEVNSITRAGWTEELVFVGTSHHIEIARYVFEFLIGEFRRAWNRRHNKRLKKRKQFMEGCFIALFSKLLERFEKPAKAQLELGLEVSWKAKRQAYIADNFGSLKSVPVCSKDRNGVALRHGYRAGEEIEIRPGVNGSTDKNHDQIMMGNRKLLPLGKPI